MYSVTEDYKTQNYRSMRNPTHVRIRFGIIDPDAVGYSSPTDNGHLPWSAVEQFDSGVAVNKTYQTLEWNRFVLDGTNPLPLSSNPLFQGYVGSELSGEDGTWTTNPMVTITFSDYINFTGLTFKFDEPFNEYPADFRIIGYTDAVETLNVLSHPTSAFYFDANAGTNINKLELVFENSGIPYRRARILEIAYGLLEILEDEVVSNTTFNSTADLLSTVLPTCDFTFKFFDINQEYDPESPSDLWSFLESRQPVSYSLGYELDDENIEWIPVINSFTTGDVKIDNAGKITTVEFKTVGLLNLLTTNYDMGVYRPSGISLYDLAVEVMTSVGYEQTITLDSSLDSIMTTAPMPVLPVNQCMQMIANAGQCVIRTTRTGAIAIEKPLATVQDFTMDFSKMKDYPTTKKYPMLRNVISSYAKYTPETASSQLATVDITGASATDIEVTYEMSYNQSSGVTGTLVVNSATYYAYKAVLNVTGTGTLTINGYKVIKSNVGVTKAVNIGGDDCEIANDLVTSETDALAYCDWVALVLNRRNEYSTSDRGYPELDVLDNVLFQGNFNSDITTTILGTKHTYNGAISGETKLLIGGES